MFNSFVTRQSAPGRHEFDLSGKVIGTHDFGVPYRPVFCREVVPGDIWNIKLSTFVRLASMQLPTFGSVRLVNRFFFVPMQVIHGAWNDFYSGNIITRNGSAISPQMITVRNSILCDAFRYSVDSQETNQKWIVKTSSQRFDIHYFYGQEDEMSNLNFTRRGLMVYSILKGLGYTLDFHEATNTVMSAMPLLAYAKICYDWLVDSNFVNSIDFDVPELFTRLSGELNSDEIIRILKVFSTCYEKDYFTSAWQLPNQVDGNSAGNVAPFSFNGSPDPTLTSSGTLNNTGNSTYLQLSTGRYLTAYGLRALESFSSYVRNRLFIGFRVDKQIEQEFGLKLSSDLAHRCFYLGSVEVPISISDVMATSSYDAQDYEVRLGEYAGKGIGFNDGFLRFSANEPEFGYIICMSAVVPDTGYVQGRHRELFHLKKTDFFDAKFENLGVQAIRNDEILSMYRGDEPTQLNPDGIFGYGPRYAEYKCGAQTDNMVGDYLSRNLNLGMDAFHLFRMFDTDSNTPPVNTYSFKTTADSSQFTRIFQLPDPRLGDITPEHFNVSWKFDVKVERMMLPINDISDEYANGPQRQFKHADDLLHG